MTQHGIPHHGERFRALLTLRARTREGFALEMKRPLPWIAALAHSRTWPFATVAAIARRLKVPPLAFYVPRFTPRSARGLERWIREQEGNTGAPTRRDSHHRPTPKRRISK